MPTLISDTEKSNLTGIFNDIFDTFKRDIVVHKEPKRVVDSINYTYVPQSGSYKATIRYDIDQATERLGDIPQKVSVGHVYIKVQEPCKNYINKGKTEKITFDNKSYKIISEDANRSFLDSKFFVYRLEATK